MGSVGGTTGAELVVDGDGTNAIRGSTVWKLRKQELIAVITHWIGGEHTTGTSDRTSPVFSPATGTISDQVVLASVDDVAAAVVSAREASLSWRETSLGRRAEIMFKAREIFDGRRRELAEIISAEHGKVPSDALGEIARGLENVEFACGIPNLLKGGFSEQAAGGVDVFSIRQPLGVVAGITPFNFPAMVPMWMFANAIATGNSFILKPSEKDPSAAMFIAEVMAEAGLPAGVFNVVHGDKVAVDAILTHPDIAAVSFVGSTPIAKYIYETGTANGKRVQALGGAKNHMIVLPDAEIDAAADAAISAAYGSAGERCMAISVVVAVGSIGDELVGAIEARLDKVKIGPGGKSVGGAVPVELGVGVDDFDVAKDGSVYFSSGRVLYKVAPDGAMTIIADPVPGGPSALVSNDGNTVYWPTRTGVDHERVMQVAIP